jgi:chaperonin GroEL (HSP60 family)
MNNKPPQSVVFQPGAAIGLQRGINQIVDAVAPTLGPIPWLVAFEETVTPGIELLDSGGTIARRITDLADHDADMGAMLVRQMLWQLQEDAGDGTATAALIFQTIFNEGLR